MKLVNRISAVAVLVFFSIGTAGALILLHGCADLSLLLHPSRWFADMHTAIPFMALGVLLFGAVVMLLWFLYFIRHVVKTLHRAEDFIRSILTGNLPQPLSTKGVRDDEIVSLFSTLNFMRDRQVNLSERLRFQRESEEKLRQEIEYFDGLQIAALEKLLPEMRRSAGVVKAYTLIELVQAKKAGNENLENRTMLSSLRRQARLSRELDFLSDLAKLERKRWSSPVTEHFSTIGLTNELTDRCNLSLQSRQIQLVCEYRSDMYDELYCDRELLYQLLHLLIRSVSRSLMGGSVVTLNVYGDGRHGIFEVSDRREDPHREQLAENYRRYFSDPSSGSPDISDCSLSVTGLEIVRTVAEKTGCSLEVSSSGQSPTILRILVPAHRTSSVRKNPDVPYLINRNISETAEHTPPRLDKLHILLSDDDKEEADALSRLLAYDDIELEVYPDNTALKEAVSTSRKIDGIIIAAPFRKTSPQTLIPELRHNCGKKDLPILVITPVHKRELALEIASIPGVTCLVSPLNFSQAVTLLRNSITR